MVYRKGLRNFLFLNVPPEERSPAQVNDVQFGPVLKRNIDLFNYVLQSFISAFSYTHEEANVITFDAHEWFNYVLDNGEKFGFTNTTGYMIILPNPRMFTKMLLSGFVPVQLPKRPPFSGLVSYSLFLFFFALPTYIHFQILASEYLPAFLIPHRSLSLALRSMSIVYWPPQYRES